MEFQFQPDLRVSYHDRGTYALSMPTSRRGGSDGISIAPALDTAALVIDVAWALSREPLPEPKSSKRIPAIPRTATTMAIIAGIASLWLSFP
jgi:hypothetical protein